MISVNEQNLPLIKTRETQAQELAISFVLNFMTQLADYSQWKYFPRGRMMREVNQLFHLSPWSLKTGTDGLGFHRKKKKKSIKINFTATNSFFNLYREKAACE